MAFPEIALYCSIALCLPGLIFMATGKNQIALAFGELEVLKGKALAPEVGGFIIHCLFMLGHLAWCWAMTAVSLAFGIPPVLALTTGSTSVALTLLYMAVKGESITGLPEFYGPPIPARVIVGGLALILNTNLVLTIVETGVPLAFWIMDVIAIAVPQLLGLKLRKEGWMSAEVVP